MAHLWSCAATSDWVVLPLETDTYALGVDPPRTLSACPAAADAPALALLVRAGAEAEAGWFVLAPARAELRVNGLPLALGMRALSDRDEISLSGAARAFFSTETLARTVAFPEGLPPVSCPRCLEPIAAGTSAVRCPRCGVWHHEREERRCWTYTATCQLCPQPSALDAGYRWSPEDL